MSQILLYNKLRVVLQMCFLKSIVQKLYLVPDKLKVECGVPHNVKEVGLVNQAVGNLLF